MVRWLAEVDFLNPIPDYILAAQGKNCTGISNASYFPASEQENHKRRTLSHTGFVTLVKSL